MAFSIKMATIRIDGVISDISLDDMTKELWHENSRNLFCPNRECDARIEFASGSKRTYFRTKRSYVNGEEIVEQHIADCPFSVEHEKELGVRGRYDPNVIVALSDDHIDNSLKRAYKKLLNPDYGKKKNDDEPSTKGKSRQSKKDNSLISRGRASLTVPYDEESSSLRQPSIFIKNINDITEKDYGFPRTISGFMNGFVSTERDKYILLDMSDGRKGRIYFGEVYRNLNNAQYSQIDIYKNYFDIQKEKGKQIIVACIGEVTKDDFDVSVVMNNYKAIYLDNKKHYEILNLFR